MVEMVELDVQMGDDLIAKVRNLALRYFGDDTDASQAQVLEAAIRMRCFWSRLVKEGQKEIEETITEWEFLPFPATKENDTIIRNWLFRR